MNRLCRLMYASRGPHGHQAVRVTAAGLGLTATFAPMPRGATNPAPTTVPFIDSTANATMNIGSTT